MRESKIESKLRGGVEALGGTCEKLVTPGKVGPPDRLICWPGEKYGRYPVAEFVETKAPGGALEPWQQRDHDRRRLMGFNVYVLWSLEQVEAYLRSRGKL